MALPVGITTATVTVGVPVTHAGAPVKTFVSIEPSVFLVHAATGTPLVDFMEELDIAEGVAGQFTLPHTDQAGFTDENGNAYTNWYYTARVTYTSPSKAKVKAPKIKVFQLTTGQTEVDLDKLPGGAPALPYTAPTAKVDAFNGRTGAVTLLEADLPERLSEGELNATFVPQSVIDTTQAPHAAQITTASDSGKNGMRIVNAANSYGLKVDQSGTGGVHDAVNIAANFTGGHTPFSVNSNNTTLSTVKIVNDAVQTGGAVIVGIGSQPTRTAQIIQADNSGSGASFLATQQPGATGAAVQVQYQAGGSAATYNSRAVWIQARHTGGDIVFIENAADTVQTTGSLMHLAQNVGSSAPCLQLSPYGTGPGLKINASGASILAQIGNNFSVDANGTVRPNSIVNGVSFNNASITPGTTGTIITRNVADGQPNLQLKNLNASSTGDIVQYYGIASSASIASRVDKNGYFMTRKNAAPADADLANGEMAIWFDPTPGTGGFRAKGKLTDGTIVNKSL